jgi:hypothetical protein
MWIAWQVGLAQKPEIARIARRLKVTPLDAAARCMIVWEWADANTTTGSIDGMSVQELSDAVRMPGFCEAMRDEGWLLEDAKGIVFPHFDRWNGDTTKARLQAAKRQAKHRGTK